MGLRRPLMPTLVGAMLVAVAACGGPAPEPIATTAPANSQILGIRPVGVTLPDDHYQRYRRAEYPLDRDFYQWWFFSVRDVQNRVLFTFTYEMLDAVANPGASAARGMFSMTDVANATAFQKTESFPLSQFQVQNDFDVTLFADAAQTQPVYTINALGNGQYRIRGQMVAPVSAVNAVGNFQGVPVDPGTVISWDLTLQRIDGWYPESDAEGVSRNSGIIAWNSYANESHVTGTIQVGAQTYQVTGDPQWRAYGDMNWGVDFPQGNPGEDSILYPWGWYDVGVPGDTDADEQSYIAGTATLHNWGIQSGSFADARMGQQGSVEFVGTEIYKPAPDKPGFKIYDASDGAGFGFEVERDDWTPYADVNGTALIPLHQKVTVTTFKHRVTLDFYSSLDEYNRLPFFGDGYVFSDFEAMGVDVHVTVEKRVAPLFPWWTAVDEWSNAGGLEFGYKAGYQPAQTTFPTPM